MGIWDSAASSVLTILHIPSLSPEFDPPPPMYFYPPNTITQTRNTPRQWYLDLPTNVGVCGFSASPKPDAAHASSEDRAYG